MALSNTQVNLIHHDFAELRDRVETLTHLQRETNQHLIALMNATLRTNQLLEALVTQGSIPRPTAPQDE